jgi:two-component system, NarL family, response regulator LiaR
VNTIKVLVAEDHLITRQGICRLLTDEHQLTVVGEAGDGEEAIKKVRELQPDVVIMDIAMPKLNGIEATKQIKSIRPSTAVLILSAYDDDEYIIGLLLAGAAGYLLKTTSGEALINAIKAVNQGEPVLDPKITHKVISHFISSGKSPIQTKNQIHFSDRELEVIKLAAKGMSNKDISEELHLSRRTIEGNLRMIFNKLGVGSRTEAVIQVLAKGLLSLEDMS